MRCWIGCRGLSCRSSRGCWVLKETLLENLSQFWWESKGLLFTWDGAVLNVVLVLNGVEVVVVELFSWQTAIEKRKTSRESIILNKYLKRVQKLTLIVLKTIAQIFSCSQTYPKVCSSREVERVRFHSFAESTSRISEFNLWFVQSFWKLSR